MSVSVNKTLTQIERLAVLEVKVEQMISDQQAINKKLDELLVLRNKGLGAFWLASALFGTGIIGSLVSFIIWLKGGSLI